MFDELAPRAIQSISCKVRGDVYFSPWPGPVIKWTGDFWSKSISFRMLFVGGGGGGGLGK